MDFGMRELQGMAKLARQEKMRHYLQCIDDGRPKRKAGFLHSLSCEMKCEMLRKYRIAMEMAAMQNRSMFKKEVISKVTIWKIGQISAMMIRIFGTNYDY